MKPEQSKKPFSILVIDDNAAVLASATTYLEAAGFEVIATDRTVGIAKHIRQCDMIIIDYHMPGIDGADVLASLRQAAEASGVKPLFFLYTSNDEHSVHARKLGFDGALFDKGNGVRLVEQVRAAVRLQRLQSRG